MKLVLGHLHLFYSILPGQDIYATNHEPGPAMFSIARRCYQFFSFLRTDKPSTFSAVEVIAMRSPMPLDLRASILLLLRGAIIVQTRYSCVPSLFSAGSFPLSWPTPSRAECSNFRNRCSPCRLAMPQLKDSARTGQTYPFLDSRYVYASGTRNLL
jgi:hypothetical protein